MQTLKLNGKVKSRTPYYPYTDEKLDRIISKGRFITDGNMIALHVEFYRMEVYGYSIYGLLYREAKSKQVFHGCTQAECIRHAKAYFRTVELC